MLRLTSMPDIPDKIIAINFTEREWQILETIIFKYIPTNVKISKHQ